jgi:hypothetical protein
LPTAKVKQVAMMATNTTAQKTFIDEDFLLRSETARILYHDYAKEMPIIDYHCHLPPDQIAQDKQFENLTQIWLYGDHYKWRAMRANGINEKYCTGHASDWEKFEQWAATVPYTMRNPLYHWTHLELLRYFDIDILLNKDTAREIYDECSAKLKQKDFSVRSLLKRMNVRVICTTDDPTDSLEYHQLIRDSDLDIKVLPTFRPDKAMLLIDSPADYQTEAPMKIYWLLLKIVTTFLLKWADVCQIMVWNIFMLPLMKLLHVLLWLKRCLAKQVPLSCVLLLNRFYCMILPKWIIARIGRNNFIWVH